MTRDGSGIGQKSSYESEDSSDSEDTGSSESENEDADEGEAESEESSASTAAESSGDNCQTYAITIDNAVLIAQCPSENERDVTDLFDQLGY